MNTLATLALLAWVPLSATLFGIFKPRQALLFSYVVGWLFLPWESWVLPGFPSIFTLTKINAVAGGAILGSLIFDSNRLLSFRVRAVDLPMIAWTLVPFISSVTNGLGLYDGANQLIERLGTWTVPYLCGRLYFRDAESLRELGIAVFLGGLAYVPLALIEMRMSPLLHGKLYGGNPMSLGSSKRFGGWRPKVFMQSGLAMGFWMSTCALVGLQISASGAVRKLFTLKASLLSRGLLLVTIMCRSLGALSLLAMGWGTLVLIRMTKSALPAILLMLVPVTYIVVRGTGVWSGDSFVELVKELDEDRASSIGFRFENENYLVDRALEQPVFGWGTWGRNIPLMDDGKPATPDGLWVIAFGQNGFVGLLALIGVFLLPAYSWLRRVPAVTWDRPEAAIGAAMALVLAMSLIDNLLNAMVNPVLMVFAGAVACARVSPKKRKAKPSEPDAAPKSEPASPGGPPVVGARREL